MSLVLDCSATLAWVYADETSQAIRQIFDRVANEGPSSLLCGGWKSQTA